MSKSIQLTINGKPEQFDSDLTIADLLSRLELNPKQCAVEVNRDLVPRESHSDHSLANGDEVEVVTFVGGG